MWIHTTVETVGVEQSPAIVSGYGSYLSAEAKSACHKKVGTTMMRFMREAMLADLWHDRLSPVEAFYSHSPLLREGRQSRHRRSGRHRAGGATAQALGFE
jgi:hypothetical protein